MVKVSFTPNIQRHVACPSSEVQGRTVREVLEAFFSDNERARGYVLDDRGGLRTNVVVFVDGEAVKDRTGLTDAVAEDGEVHVMQALSGG